MPVKSRIFSGVSSMAFTEGQKSLRAYRLLAPRWVESALSGEGARKFGGRWNSVGTAMIYLAGSRALAALETLVHLTTPATRAKPFSMIEVTLPANSIETLSVAALPKDWELSPPAQATMTLGDEWLQSQRSLVLRVPSTLVPGEPNYLLNPQHPAMAEVTASKPVAFSFDPRLVG